MKNAFTLIEMLVVIAIIGILAGIVVPLSGDAIRTSREATCRNNLRNLQVAAVNHANDRSGALPRAGSFEVLNHQSSWWEERKGWISWVGPDGHMMYREEQKNEQRSSMKDGWTVGAEGFNATRALFAITNGTLFAYTSGDLGLYICPEAVKADGFKVFGQRKGFSTYVMNEFFYWEGCKEPGRWNDPRHLSRIGTNAEKIDAVMDSSNRGFKGFAPESANLLLFAEHCGGSPKVKNTRYGPVEGWKDGDFTIGKNCVLHVPSNSPDDTGKASFLGTPHGRSNSPRGHAVFLDGHIIQSAVALPKDSDSPVKNFVYWYCRGESPDLDD